MGRGEAKAAGVTSFLSVLRQTVPADQLEAFVATLPPATQELVRHPPLPVAWIPMDVTQPLYEGAFERLFHGDVERIFEVGRIQLKADMRGIYRIFMRIATVAYVASRASQIWETYSRDGGQMRVVREEPHLIEIEVTDHARPSRGMWHYLRGSIHGVIELTGAKGLRVSIVSGGGPGPDARYRATWQ